MPEVIPEHAPMPRSFLAWDGTAYRVCTVDANGHLQVDVLSSALPAGAATAFTQALIYSRLANNSMRFSDRLVGSVIDNNVAAGNITVYGTTPGPGVWWLVQQIGATNKVSVCTEINGGIESGATAYFVQGITNPLAWRVVNLPGPFLLTGTDRVRVAFRGCTLNDDLQIWWTGWIVDIT